MTLRGGLTVKIVTGATIDATSGIPETDNNDAPNVIETSKSAMNEEACHADE
jgi:hypothetical protein